MDVKLCANEAVLPTLREIPVGQVCLRLYDSTGRLLEKDKRFLLMRANPCDLRSSHTIHSVPFARNGGDDPMLGRRDTYVVNLSTGQAWFAQGLQKVLPMKASVEASRSYPHVSEQAVSRPESSRPHLLEVVCFAPWMGKFPRACSPWTREEEQEAVKDFRLGKTLGAIAKRHGRSENGIVEHIQGVMTQQEFRKVMAALYPGVAY